MLYLWLKALHVAAAAIWIGGLLIAALAVGAASSMEARPDGERRGWLDRVRRWDRRVTSPAMLAVWGLGLAMAIQGGWFASRWLMAKLAVVLALSALHGLLSGSLRRAAKEGGLTPHAATRNAGSATIVAVLTIAILAVTKPF